MSKSPAAQTDIRRFAGLTQDSRTVKPGYLFAAFPGASDDGREYIPQALGAGASAILAKIGTKLPAGSTAELIESGNPRRAFAQMAAEFYGEQPERIVAVTGTNGKSSTVYFAQQLWQALGEKSAFLGTLGVGLKGAITAGSMTTPDPVKLHEALAQLVREEGITHLAMEASSHGLEQYRLDGVKLGAAGFTSFSRDHLDYHENMEAYLSAKARLFSEVLQESGAAILNADIPEFKQLESICQKRGIKIISYGKKAKDIRLKDVKVTAQGQTLSLEIGGKSYNVNLPLVGDFQAMNALCALGLVWAGAPDRLEDLIRALETLQSVPGRLQHVEIKTGSAYVDYAHTPDALETVLKALRPHTKGKLICLFGCGGDRDTGKRPVMGEIAARLADMVIITDDNPRSEEPAAIRASILQGAGSAAKITEIAGRREAIRMAVKNMGEADVLLVAGKGHEQGQIFADHTDPFDDVDEVKKSNLAYPMS
ncbi:MAG: UDP-N-acetylmuramoyl-L-alanyl-D-glutamate--2,6-diaminopimelate ligase [Alphaproteobacteria bacterium]|nr:UDP-N-acetylmuramoyl-L-alanyl-D-glutamate--2,6-diaminopimelate ligase [Alphaproteobacteria bacterium]